MRVSDWTRRSSAAQQRAITRWIGALGAAKFVLLVIRFHLLRLVSGMDPIVLEATGLIVVGLVASYAVARGTHTRLAAAVVASASWLLIWRVPAMSSHHFTFLTWLFVIAAFVDEPASEVTASPDGAVTPVATRTAWPLQLFRCQLSIVYLFTAVSKINTDFLSGLVAYELLHNSVVHLPLPAGLDHTAWFLGPMAAVTLVGEAVLAVALWSPRWRRLAFAVSLPLHVGMTFLASGTWLVFAEIVVFSLAVFAVDFSFVDVPVERARLSYPRGDPGAAKAARWIGRLDLLHTTDVVAADPAAAEGEARWTLTVGGGPTVTGWRAVQEVLGWSPVAFLPAAWLGFPGVRGRAAQRFGASDARPAGASELAPVA